MLSNLPPGVTESMVPGDSPWWDRIIENLPDDIVDIFEDSSHPLNSQLESYTENFDEDYNPADVASKIVEYYSKLEENDEEL